MKSAVGPGALVDDAVSLAASAADRSGVVVEPLESLSQVEAGASLLIDIWGAESGGAVLPPELLRALAHSGNYVTGAYAGDRLVAVSVGFLGLHHGDVIVHSHISGVARDVQHKSIGYALKLHQRAWSLQ